MCPKCPNCPEPSGHSHGAGGRSRGGTCVCYTVSHRWNDASGLVLRASRTGGNQDVESFCR